MTRDDIIRMAKEAGWKRVGHNPDTGPEFPVLIGNLERFAAFVVAHEREDRKKLEDEWYYRGYDAAQTDEREACASIADQHSAPIVASKIRARGVK